MELPKHVDQCLLEQLVCDELGGFLIILTSSGKIIFVSQTVENLLAHSQVTKTNNLKLENLKITRLLFLESQSNLRKTLSR